MAIPKTDPTTAEIRIRKLAGQLRMHREHPCLLFVSRSLQHSDVLAVRSALGEEAGAHLDVIVSSPGGDIEAAYLVARARKPGPLWCSAVSLAAGRGEERG